LQMGSFEFEKAESHPAGRTALDLAPPTWLRDLGIKLSLSNLATPRNDRIGKILPDNGEKCPWLGPGCL
jgi:hypothetical protein